jgi:hypothetical protein
VLTAYGDTLSPPKSLIAERFALLCCAVLCCTVLCCAVLSLLCCAVTCCRILCRAGAKEQALGRWPRRSRGRKCTPTHVPAHGTLACAGLRW